MKKKIYVFIMIVASLSWQAEINAKSLNTECRSSESQSQCEIRLRAEIAQKEAEIKKYEQNIKEEKGNQQTITGEILRLRSEIQKTSSAIRKKNNLISNLRNEIVKKEQTLEELNDKLRREKESLEKILRKRYELSDTTLFEFILANKSLSDFYRDAPAFSYIQSSLSRSFQHIKDLKFDIYGEKISLETKKEEEDSERYILNIEKGKIENKKKEHDQALKISKSKEATLAQLKKIRQAEIAKIRAKLIQFHGNGVSRPISFGEAYDYAKLASSKTGVDPAFLIAIMEQETRLGRNIGGCYVTNLTTGDGIGKDTGKIYEKVMGPGSLLYYKSLMDKLGFDWRKKPVSCPIDLKRRGSARKYYRGRGYGGAMGYTQFIPSTWKRYEARIKKALNLDTYISPNPWNPEHAIMATALFVRDWSAYGKPSQSRASYLRYVKAACKYYGVCGTYNNSVMNKTAQIQKTIDILERDSN